MLNDVSDPSPDDPITPESPVADPTPVSGDVAALPVDRPAENLKAEFDRKFGLLQKQLTDLTGTLGAYLSQPPPQSYPTRATEPTDAEVEQAAQQGNWQAQAELSRRAGAREAAALVAADQRARAVAQEVALLAQQYPAFNDPTSPLYLAATQMRHAYIAAGYANTLETTLLALEKTLVRNPALVAETVRKPATAGELSRQSAVAGTNIVEGSPRRPSTASTTPTPALTQKAKDIAKRMGVKDPEGAVKRLYERHEKGQSSVSPTIALITKEQS